MKFKIGFLAILFLALASYYIVAAGFYPAALVNGGWISARDFEKYFSSAAFYFQNLLSVYSGPEAKLEQGSLSQIRKSVLEKMIEDRLVLTELKKILGKETAELIGEKIPGADSRATALYGLNPAQFRSMVLEPQAAREIMENRLGYNLNDWLASAKKSAKITVLAKGLKWQGGVVEK